MLFMLRIVLLFLLPAVAQMVSMPLLMPQVEQQLVQDTHLCTSLPLNTTQFICKFIETH